MNILFVGIRAREEEITDAPKKISNALYNRMSKAYDNVYFFGLPWENEQLEDDNNHVMVAGLKSLGKFIKQKNIDVVYFSRYYTKIALYLAAIKPIYKFKLVYTVHGIIKKEKLINGTFKFYSAVIEERLLKSCDKIIAVSHGLRDELLKYYPNLEKDKIEIIFNGVEIRPVKGYVDIRKLFNIDENRKILFTTGTRKIKNNELLIQSILGNRELRNSVFLIIAGVLDTDYARDLAEKYKDVDNIKFTGKLNVDLVNNVYSQMDLYIQISSFETFGIAIVEALLHKKKVLVSKALPISHYFTQEEVFLFDPEKSLGDAITICLMDSSVNQKGCDKARELFNFDIITEKYYKAFMDVL